MAPDAAGGRVNRFYNQYGYHYASQDANSDVVYYQSKTQDAFGNVTSYSLHNDVTEGLARYEDETGLVDTLQVSGNASIQHEEYDWDVLGNLRWRKDLHQNLEETFEYDGLNRLLSSNVHGYTIQEIAYFDNGNIKHKTGVGYYCYSNARPHAVTGLKATESANCASPWTYDGNGNLRNGKTVDGNTRNIHYTLFDKPTLIEVNNTQTHFAYGVDTTRYKRIDIDAQGEQSTTWYIGNVEFVEKGAQVTTKRHIDGVVQVISQSNASNTSADHLEYVYQIKDHLGSIVATVNHTGAQLKRYSYDAWGQRRGTDWSIPGHTPSSISGFTGFTSNLPIQISQTRGFTGHEHVDNAGLIHMNGRIYDPVLGRFMSADPYIQAATNAQSLNRYSYVWNNPLNATDPSGYIVEAIALYAINYFAAQALTYVVGAQITATLLTAYQIYNTAKMVNSVVQAYSAWNNGSGGSVWGNLIGGLAKGYFINLAIGGVVESISNTEIGHEHSDTKELTTEISQAKQEIDFDENGDPIPEDVYNFARDTDLGLELADGKLTGDIKWSCNGPVSICNKSIEYFNEMSEINSDILNITNTLITDRNNADAFIHFVNTGSKGHFDLNNKVIRMSLAAPSLSRAMQHEFGHAIGLMHQHNATQNFMSYYNVRSNMSPVISKHQEYWLRQAYKKSWWEF
ncbi:RHS repeat-associated core domain-containing protein [Glaciecola sp. KUL10]|uniref:RHS repeat-associated core domain-containing protein n=1 Tax=Glaciecola sp. (strain KUL10) TaxID=2161813 RepID=UPI000D784F09|nr:RHS repeat-associated core domain-containing protein [Glaciecola sp. KUL10]GBL06321.1 hypothetical protein KUL10_36610 [Glaciecola sp. KUL10]